MSRQILFIPFHRETLRCGDWFELSKSDRLNYKRIYGEVRLRYPRDEYDILITTNEDKVPMMAIVPYEGTYLVEEHDNRHPIEKILDIEPDNDADWWDGQGEREFWRR